VMKRIEHPASGGSIRTLLGRKCRFPLWEPTEWGVNKALPREQAVIEYGSRIKRAGTYKGLNRLIQGSAADLMAKAVNLEIPSRVDVETGPSWGEAA